MTKITVINLWFSRRSPILCRKSGKNNQNIDPCKYRQQSPGMDQLNRPRLHGSWSVLVVRLNLARGQFYDQYFRRFSIIFLKMTVIILFLHKLAVF
jgi:hypothetical protein